MQCAARFSCKDRADLPAIHGACFDDRVKSAERCRNHLAYRTSAIREDRAMKLTIEIVAAALLVICITATSAAFAAGKPGRSADGLSCALQRSGECFSGGALRRDPPPMRRKIRRQLLRRQDAVGDVRHVWRPGPSSRIVSWRMTFNRSVSSVASAADGASSPGCRHRLRMTSPDRLTGNLLRSWREVALSVIDRFE